MADPLQQLQAVVLHPGRRAPGGRHRDRRVRRPEYVQRPERSGLDVFSCEGAALEVLISVCLSVRLSLS